MGLTFLELEIANPANPAVTERLDFLIDSGAIYSVVPAPVLERLGIQPLAMQEFRLANGTKVQRKKGMAVFKYGDRIGDPEHAQTGDEHRERGIETSPRDRGRDKAKNDRRREHGPDRERLCDGVDGAEPSLAELPSRGRRGCGLCHDSLLRSEQLGYIRTTAGRLSRWRA